MNTLTFNNVNSSTFSLFISGEGTFDGTARNVQTYNVPGRNGTLVIDNGFYDNISVSYPAFIVDAFDANFGALRAFLLSHIGYFKLSDTYHPTEFRMARYTGNIAPKMTQYNREGEFTITFDCKPQRFLVSGETVETLTADDTVTNPTLFDSKPLLRVYGYGDLGVGSDVITIAQNDYPFIDIDCDTENAQYNTTNCNDLITLTGDSFPVFHAGANGITLDANITQVDITPRWFTL